MLKDEAHKVVDFGVLSVGFYKTSMDSHNFVRCVQSDAPPSYLIDSTASPRVNTT